MDTVFDSPALPLLLELENAALVNGAELVITITYTGRLRVAPRSLLTPERRERIRAHRDALCLLVQIAGAGVQARAQVFRRQLHAHNGPAAYPALRFTPPVQPGGCVSCGEPAEAAVWCWQCQIAARLARDGDVPADWVPVGRPARSAAA